MDFLAGAFCGIMGCIIAKPKDLEFIHNFLFEMVKKIMKKKPKD
jgi:hypothetical protein